MDSSSHGIQKLVTQLTHRHTGKLDRVQPLSWTRCLLSLVSYALFFSDVLRSGLGYQGLPGFETLESNNYVIFGPVAYPIAHITSANATSGIAAPYWPYKYDTTSASTRALAQYLNVSEWSPCLLYTENCDESSGIPLRTVFGMLDSLVGKIREYRPQSSSKRRGHPTLRIKMEFLHRLHDYIFPWLFQYPFVGTVQVISYGRSELVRRQFGICGPSNPRPYACKHQWTRFSRTCHPTEMTCVNVGSVWLDVTRRYSMLEGTYPNRIIETAVIENTNVNRPEGLRD